MFFKCWGEHILTDLTKICAKKPQLPELLRMLSEYKCASSPEVIRLFFIYIYLCWIGIEGNGR